MKKYIIKSTRKLTKATEELAKATGRVYLLGFQKFKISKIASTKRQFFFLACLFLWYGKIGEWAWITAGGIYCGANLTDRYLNRNNGGNGYGKVYDGEAG